MAKKARRQALTIIMIMPLTEPERTKSDEAFKIDVSQDLYTWRTNVNKGIQVTEHFPYV
jgi:hypothetical protein